MHLYSTILSMHISNKKSIVDAGECDDANINQDKSDNKNELLTSQEKPDFLFWNYTASLNSNETSLDANGNTEIRFGKDYNNLLFLNFKKKITTLPIKNV